jgi:hypothetical protein
VTVQKHDEKGVTHDKHELTSEKENLEDNESAWRQLPKYLGLYVEGQVQDTDVIITVDTGASTSIVSTKLYKQIPEHRRPKLDPIERFIGNAEGSKISCKGTAPFKIDVGPVQLEHYLVVADIEDEVLLGMDILLGKKGPADILLSEGKIVLHGMVVPLIKLPSANHIKRVRASDHFIIPAMSEKFIDAFIDFQPGDSPENCATVLIETAPKFCEKQSLLVAASLADPKSSPTVRVRIINPFSEPQSIK